MRLGVCMITVKAGVVREIFRWCVNNMCDV